MLTQEKILELLRNESSSLRDSFGVKRIGLFGSFAKKTQRHDSDVDIYVEFEKPIGFRFMEFAEYMERLFNRKVDIVTFAGLRSIRIEDVARDIERHMLYV